MVALDGSLGICMDPSHDRNSLSVSVKAPMSDHSTLVVGSKLDNVARIYD